jgi:CheY-like chemotaxis protein
MKNVLLVDDDETCNFLMSKILERTGLVGTVSSALNGVQAIDLLSKARENHQQLPDVILLDLNMPIMDGFGFLESLTKNDLLKKNNTRIIVVTSSENKLDVQKAKEMGADDYIVKPVSEEKLRSILQK